jgi:hypothetical protein
MGIRFDFSHAGEREELERFVGDLMEDKLGSHVAQKLLGKP